MRGQINLPVCIDSNCCSYLVDAMVKSVRPTGDVAGEKIALLRIYFYSNDTLYVSPTVKAEYEKMKNEGERRNHQGVVDILLGDIQPTAICTLESRIMEYAEYHTGKKNKTDCRILAETELGGGQILLTYDQDFLKRLRGRTHTVRMMTPSEFWSSLGLSKGIEPVKVPHPTNPLSSEKWWIW
jgi:predicted nucleic acid-binding protein